MEKITLLVADRQDIVRAGCRHLFDDSEDIVLVGEVAGGDDLLEAYDRLQPDILIIGRLAPGSGGLEMSRKILEKDPSARIIILAAGETSFYLGQAMKMGAKGCISMDMTADELPDAVRHVAEGGVFINGRNVSAPSSAGISDESEKIRMLTNREFEVFHLLAEGRSVLETAKMLDISPKTVRHHYGSTKNKLGVTNVVNLTHMAIRGGVVSV